MQDLEKVKRYHLYWFLIFLFIVLVRLVSFRSGYANIDENEYAIAASKILAGGIPYKDFLIYQPPVVYYFYTLVFGLFGSENFLGVHFFLLIVVLLSSYVIGSCAKILFSSENAALLAGLFYAVTSFAFIPHDMLAANCEILAVLPISLAAYFYLNYEKNGRLKDLFFAGLFVGISAMIKYQCGVILLPIVIILLFKRREIVSTLLVLGGMAIPIAVVISYLCFAGAWEETKDAWLYILKYAKGPVQCDLCYIVLKFIARTVLIATSGFFVWQFAIRWLKGSLKFSPFLFVWFILSFIPVVMGGRIYFHYYFVVLPPLCLLAVGGALKLRTSSLLVILMAIVQFGLVTGWLIFDSYRYVTVKGPKNDWTFTAEYLRENTAKNETLFIWGYAPQIYVSSGLAPSTRFTTADYLTGRSPMTAGLEYDPNGTHIPSCFEKVMNDFKDPDGVVVFDTSDNIFPKAWEYLRVDFEKGLPTYIVDTSGANYRRYGRYPISNYPYLQETLDKNYSLIKEIKGYRIYRLKGAVAQ